MYFYIQIRIVSLDLTTHPHPLAQLQLEQINAIVGREVIDLEPEPITRRTKHAVWNNNWQLWYSFIVINNFGSVPAQLRQRIRLVGCSHFWMSDDGTFGQIAGWALTEIQKNISFFYVYSP
jgi:hypothetical protein